MLTEKMKNKIYEIQKKVLQEQMKSFPLQTSSLHGDLDLTSPQKGNFFEIATDVIFIEKKNADILTQNRVLDIDESMHNGIDLVAYTEEGFVIGEVKYNSGRIKKNSKQMSKTQVLGKDLDDAVGSEIAEIIRITDTHKKVQYVLVKFTYEGISNTSITLDIYQLDETGACIIKTDGKYDFERIQYDKPL